MPAQLNEPLNRILAIRLDNIGDVVMTGPALRALRQAYPNAQLTLMASPAGSQVAPLLPWVDDVITWRAVWQDIAKSPNQNPAKERELFSLLEQGKFDAAFIFTSFSQSPHPPAYACYLAGIPVRVGQSKEFGGAVLTHSVRPLSDNVYQVDRNLYLLRAVGLPVKQDHLELHVRADDALRADDLLAASGIGSGDQFLVLAPGASAASRRYDPSRFAEAVRILRSETGLPVVMVGSQREAGNFPALETLAADDPRVISLIGRTTVPEMAAVIERSALLLANNSGSMHIAAAFNRPMVILFAGTELFEQWAPRTADSVLINRTTECAPCHAFQCPYQMECLDINPREIADAAVQILRSREHLSRGSARLKTWKNPLAGAVWR